MRKKLSTTLMKNLSMFKWDESTRETERVYQSFRPNVSEKLNSHQLSVSFGPGFMNSKSDVTMNFTDVLTFHIPTF